MSHFTAVAQANIVSESAFISACKELGYEQIEKNGKIRGWRGQTRTVDLAVKCPDQEYDFGISKKGDKFELIAESFFPRAALNKVVQYTTKHQIISDYRRKGFHAQVAVKEDASLHVTLTR